jgi:hypothetical protein
MPRSRGPRPISDEIRRLTNEYMRTEGITPYAVAKRAGLPIQTLYSWLGDPDSQGKMATIDALAAFFGVGIGPVNGQIAENAQKKSRRKAAIHKDL